ncbi:sensor histidine kinase [Kineosporia babensis]|uniref:Sensor histidine kinase n=1 Tax=Kineosporia babensis TaxID=499548 RepID=A0A9X1NKM4_9ACTN|nr:sensor histidine kinase [Kineosporia babensis]MCD5316035.1 sensor histidine kinase [Kineosporia babensis]
MPLGPDARVLRRGPYVLLALAVALSALSTGLLQAQEGLPYLLGISLVLGVLHFVCADRRWHTAELNDAVGRWYLVVRTALAFVGTVLNPFYAVFATVGYFDQHLYVPRRWGALALTTTAVSMAGSQSGGFPPQSAVQWGAFIGLFALNTGLATMFSRIAAKEELVAAERVDTIAALERTNQALQEAMAENARLHEQLVDQAREAGVRDERERLALEIHDTIAQSLIGVVTQLQAAQDAADPQVADTHRGRAARMAREALGEARRSVQGLRPAQLDEAQLNTALEQLVRGWSQDTGISGELTITGAAQQQRAEVEATVLRVAQESLANVAKHAQAGRVGVTLSYTDDELVLDIRDDGVGFDPSAAVTPLVGGVGLDGMRQRAKKLAGRLVVESEKGGGTAISLWVPVLRRG